MNTPDHNPSDPIPAPTFGSAGQAIAALLELQPFPALAVDRIHGPVVAANEAARQLGLAPSLTAPVASWHAADVQGRRIEAGQLTSYLLGRAEGGDGAEITWHLAQQTLSFRVYCRPMPGAEGQAALAVLTFVDVGREKAAEAALHEAMEARNEFFSVATHELKDPLFSLQLSIQLLHHAAEKQGEVPSHVRQHLEVSHRQADRLTRLIDNLLDVSRIMNHHLHLDIEELDLSELARDVSARMRDKAQQTGATIEVQCSATVLGCFDRMKLEQVVGNLLTNAIKYGAGRPVQVRVRSEAEAAVLEVEDQGVGIAPEDQERIFRRFERVSDRHKRASLGLGLYIVRSLVEAHGGSIHVHSETGKGATFTVRLPLRRSAPLELADRDRPQTSGE